MAPTATGSAPVAIDRTPHGLCGRCLIVDGEQLTVEDTVVHAVVNGMISDDFLDHGCDTYWCVTTEGRHRILRASELLGAA